MVYEGTTEAWIVGAVRTPIGKRGGALSPVRPDDLGALVLESLMERTGGEDRRRGPRSGRGPD
jgi:acetyl-CoA acyltransferase